MAGCVKRKIWFGEYSKEYEEAVKWFKKAADQDYAPAQYMLGQCYSSGSGVERNNEEAAKWYQKAAENGHVEAQYMIAERYFSGDGVGENIKEAIKRYKEQLITKHASIAQ